VLVSPTGETEEVISSPIGELKEETASPIARMQEVTASPTVIPCGEWVTWQRAIQILHTGAVTQIFQTHRLDVEITLEGDCLIRTKEPSIDAIFREIDDCGSLCEGIILATE
jgi:hypothetical protein